MDEQLLRRSVFVHGASIDGVDCVAFFHVGAGADEWGALFFIPRVAGDDAGDSPKTHGPRGASSAAKCDVGAEEADVISRLFAEISADDIRVA